MDADISLAIEREPDFFSLARARGDSRTYVAESNGTIVGCGGVSRRPAYVCGESADIGCVGDLKVAPEFRRRGVAARILEAIRGEESTLPEAFYVGTAAAGNTGTERMVRRFGQDRRVVRLRGFTSYQLLPLGRPRVSRRFEIRMAAPGDEDELVSLLDRYHSQLSFAPVFNNGGFRALLERSPGMELESYRIARVDGRIVAALAVWDESAMKHTRVRRMNRRLRWVSRIIGPAGRVLGFPPFPSEGDLLRFVYIRHPAYTGGRLDALAALVRSAMRDVAEQRLQFALFTCADGDPIAACLRGMPRTTYQYSLLAGCNRSGKQHRLDRLKDTPVYDDAALA